MSFCKSCSSLAGGERMNWSEVDNSESATLQIYAFWKAQIQYDAANMKLNIIHLQIKWQQKSEHMGLCHNIILKLII